MYSYVIRIGYSETDSSCLLAPAAVLRIFQDCSVFQSEDLGLGLEYMRSLGQAWVLSGLQAVIERRPGMGERVTVGTFPYGFRGFVGYRNFFIKDASNSYCVKANTIWSLVDAKTGRPVKPNEAMLAGYAVEEPLEMDYAPRHIALPHGQEPEQEEALTVRKYQIDSNHHMNNSQYVQLAQEYVPEGENIVQIRAEYKRPVRLHEVIRPLAYRGSGRHVVSLNGNDGSPYAIVEFITAQKE